MQENSPIQKLLDKVDKRMAPMHPGWYTPDGWEITSRERLGTNTVSWVLQHDDAPCGVTVIREWNNWWTAEYEIIVANDKVTCT